MKDFIERQLRKVVGAHAHDPDPDKMTAWERREAEAAMRGSGRGMEQEFVDGSESAAAAARAASDTAHPKLVTELVDGSEGAEVAAQVVNEKDGSYQRSDLAEDSAEARDEAIQAQGSAPRPRSDFVDGSLSAREAAARANEPKDMTPEQKEAQKEG